MLYVAIEKFKEQSLEAVHERFLQRGRMLPPGAEYRGSWIATDGSRCFQLMESPNPKLLQKWASHWNDLVEFEIVPVLTSGDFWERFEQQKSH